MRLSLPVYSWIRPHFFVDYNPNVQWNVLLKKNNYKVDIFRYGTEVDFYLSRHWLSTLGVRVSDGKGHRNVIYPFEKDKLLEPKAYLSYQNEPHFATLSARKDSFIGNDRNKTTAIFVKTKEVKGHYYFLIDSPYSAVGFKGSRTWYEAVDSNKKDEGETYIRYAVLKEPFFINVILEYLFRYGHFDKVDRSYYSYKEKEEHEGEIRFLKTWGERWTADVAYRYSHVLRKGFNQQATIFSLPASPTLKKNEYDGHRVEARLKKVFGDSFHIEAAGKYYKNTNNYRIIGGRVDLTWVF